MGMWYECMGMWMSVWVRVIHMSTRFSFPVPVFLLKCCISMFTIITYYIYADCYNTINNYLKKS